ncbi:hypothetical protein [Pseudomonas sp. WS 5011]|uniref:hypothetical protein n=1 Tax=Pseudomonas sp. WS 5011 TaxID=2717477 RepID=UPI001475F753|nr:hypothetical protein [Pseudomonas sp. WS 5011]NMY52499.1 hypothetical protein [Pseudomonas sp. WS 5011]
MNIAALHVLIQRAHQHEASTGQLASQMQAHLDQLHPSIRLPNEDTHGVLQRFVSAYIEQVPELLQAAHEVSLEAGIEAQIKPVLKVAEQFFLQPPALMAGHEGLEGLLDEAYLAHRLVEEVNDRYIAHLGAPLIPLDTTVANLITHQLIGEAFANQLDEAVHHAVDGMLNEASFAQDSVQAYRERLINPQTDAAWKRWPCLSRQLGVELQLNETRATG